MMRLWKRSARSALIAGLAVAAASPSAGPATAGAPAGPSLQSLDVAMNGGTVTMLAPAGAVARTSFGTTFEIASGRTFQLELGASNVSLARIKQEVLANNFNVFRRYVVDEPAGMVYESALAGTPEYHVYVILPAILGGLVCQDTKGPAYNEAQARAMYAACKSVALKP